MNGAKQCMRSQKKFKLTCELVPLNNLTRLYCGYTTRAGKTVTPKKFVKNEKTSSMWVTTYSNSIRLTSSKQRWLCEKHFNAQNLYMQIKIIQFQLVTNNQQMENKHACLLLNKWGKKERFEKTAEPSLHHRFKRNIFKNVYFCEYITIRVLKKSGKNSNHNKNTNASYNIYI